VNAEIEGLARRILAAATGRDRFIVAIAGPPASGKSTLVDDLKRAIDDAAGMDCVGLFPMDGFHFDDAVLTARGERARKGAAFTFDVAGYAAALKRIRAGGEEVAVPIFDRSLELSRAAAGIIGPQHRVVLTEGNYLLLDEAPWAALGPLYDLTVRLAVPEPVLMERLTRRWHDHGKNGASAAAWIASNDLPNIRHVLARSRPADITLTDPPPAGGVSA